MKITELNGYWWDENGNRISSMYSHEQAAERLATLVNCHACTNCDNCTNCNGCSNCTRCTDCINCVNCHMCNTCHTCYGCYACTDCRDCERCLDCGICNGVSYKQDALLHCEFASPCKGKKDD